MGALVVDTQPVYSNGMFQDGECRLIRAEEVTDRNERLYRGSPNARVIGLALPAARQFFDFDSRIQGRAVVISEEDDQALEQERKDNPTLFKSRPGYRD
jgi:hypothetical protein